MVTERSFVMDTPESVVLPSVASPRAENGLDYYIMLLTFICINLITITCVINLRKDEVIDHLRHQIEELQIELVKCKSEVIYYLPFIIAPPLVTNSPLNLMSGSSWNLKEAD